jgi:UDP-glucose 4-epimerase
VKKNNVLLLGGGGFIGTALARRLAEQGRCVHIISRNPSASFEPGVIVHAGDLCDAILLKKLQPECGTVVHLATTTTPGASARHPIRELDNLAPTLHLLEILQDWQDTHLIFLSSGGTVYGNPARNPVVENSPLAPLSYHGAGKVAVEGFLQALRTTTGPAVTVLRPSNAYGPGQRLNQGFGLIRTALQHILHGTALEIWGDGESIRDFVYVEDVVEAIALVANVPADNGTYNVGSGKGYTLNEILEVTQRVCGASLRVDYRPARGMDVREVVLDISHIHSAFGWSPNISLEEGILRTWHWLQKS